MPSDVHEGGVEEHGAGTVATLGAVIGTMILLWAAVIATFPLEDNSFFTHLATGRLILDDGSVPSADPYTFTAPGVDWTVQSWLASVVYAGAERVAGDAGLRVLVVLLYLAAGWLTWRLTRPASSIVPRLLVAATAMTVFSGLWSARPYMVGVIGLAVVWLALAGSFSPWWLVPAMWVWANAHGSYPLAVALVLAVMAGSALDRRLGRQPQAPGPDLERRVLVATVVGIVAAVIGPLGFEVLTFPFTALTQSEVLAAITEWQSPGFRSIAERAFLVLLLVSFAALVRDGRWRLAVPALVFTVAALVAQRNVVLATVVLTATAAPAMPKLGTLRSGTRLRLGPAFVAVVAAAVVLVALVAVGTPAVDRLRGYPAHALAWVGPGGVGDGRLITQDVTGNLLEALDGAEGSVFIDDRADMFPPEVFADALELHRASPKWQEVLDRYEGGVVVWERSAPLASVLAADPEWRIVFSDTGWIVACRRSGGCGSLAR